MAFMEEDDLGNDNIDILYRQILLRMRMTTCPNYSGTIMVAEALLCRDDVKHFVQSLGDSGWACTFPMATCDREPG
jgi:hypothetical protein